MPFPSGKSGNPSGRRKDKKVRDALLIKLLEAGEDMPRLRAVWESIISKAETGDVASANLIFDRLDGKVPQTIAGDEDEGPVKLQLEVSWKAAKSSNSPDESSGNE